MGVCLNEWVAYHMEREQTVSVEGHKEECAMVGFQLQIGDMMMISMHDGFGYSGE